MGRESMAILGYADRWTVRPDERIEFKVSTKAVSYDAAFVRLPSGDDD